MPPALGHRGRIQNAANPCQGVRHDYVVFTHVHDLGQRQRNDRRDNDIKQKVEQKRVCYRRTVVGKPQRTGNQEGENAVDGGGLKHHRSAQFFSVRNDPLFVFVNGSYKFAEVEH